ncbi:MAG TPA: hypothetical protein ACFCUD_03255 [Cyclobacteriaceae bacterium]
MTRLIGTIPNIGIRPVIDGREQGIRESLGSQTSEMALSVKKLIESNVRTPSGNFGSSELSIIIGILSCSTVGIFLSFFSAS